MAKANNLQSLSINEELGDLPTHFMKSGSSMPRKERLDGLYKFQKEVVPKTKWGLNVEYDLWYNTNELSTIRTWIYTDFLGKGIFFRVNSVKINDRLYNRIAQDEYLEIDEDRISKITESLENKYMLQNYTGEYYDKVAFPPGSNLLGKNVVNWNTLDGLIEEGFVIKPHPITAHLYIAKMKQRYGQHRVLGKKLSGHDILSNAKEIGFCPNSQMGVEALLLGKKIRSFAIPRTAREKAHLTYEAIYAAIAGSETTTRLKRLLSSKYSGIIFAFDEDRKARTENYFNNFWDFTLRPSKLDT